MQEINSEKLIAPHDDVQANSMGVDCVGRCCILGTKRYLNMIDLNQPKNVLHRINRHCNFDVSQINWNPCKAKKEYFVVTCNYTADVWTCCENDGSHLASLKGHTRTISDVDWSGCHDSLLATCSVDTYIQIWDIREAKSPKISMSAVAGASQVKWNKMTANILATSHDGDIRIWDIRNARTPAQYITAHLSKIQCLDWSPQESLILSSSGQDTTVRFWDTSQQSVQAQCQISAGAAVWKAKYTPFGCGMVTTLMPQMHRWNYNALLWNVENSSKIIHSYEGHKDVILHFEWRYNQGERNAELVTWSKDRRLILWKCDNSFLIACGCSELDDNHGITEEFILDDLDSVGQEQAISMSGYASPIPSLMMEHQPRKVEGNVNFLTPKGMKESISLPGVTSVSPLHCFSSSPSNGSSSLFAANEMSTSEVLEEEFKLLNFDIPNLFIEEIDYYRRTCLVKVRSNCINLNIQLCFPPNYPNNVPPIFQVTQHGNIIQPIRQQLTSILQEISQKQVQKNQPCLELCLKTISSYVGKNYQPDNVSQDNYMPSYHAIIAQSGYSIYGTYQHLVKIPFPRTSGARFCGAGQLVTFMRPIQVKGFDATVESTTPRCLVALLDLRHDSITKNLIKSGLQHSPGQIGVSFGSSPIENLDISVKGFYYREKKSRKTWKHSSKDGCDSSTAQSSEKLQMRLHKAAGKVVIQDLSHSLQLNKTLAEEYIVPSKYNYIEACDHNHGVAKRVGRKDLVEVWSTLKLMKSSILNEKPSNGMPWAELGFGRHLLRLLFDHYSKLLDVQSLAMISCMFSVDPNSRLLKQHNMRHSIESSGLIGRSASHNSFENSESGSMSHRSNSFCDNPLESHCSKSCQSPQSLFLNIPESPTDDGQYIETSFWEFECKDEDMQELSINRLLDWECLPQYEAFKQAYGNILDRWRLINQRLEILKYCTQPANLSKMRCKVTCQHCNNALQNPLCKSCPKFSSICALCQLPVKGILRFCNQCGHGGHLDHMNFWFKEKAFCATGCGCECRSDCH